MVKPKGKTSIPKRGCKSTMSHVGDELRIHEKCVVPKEVFKVSAPSKVAKKVTKGKVSSGNKYYGVNMGGKKGKMFAKDACWDEDKDIRKQCVERAQDAWKNMTPDEKKLNINAIEGGGKLKGKYTVDNVIYDVG